MKLMIKAVAEKVLPQQLFRSTIRLYRRAYWWNHNRPRPSRAGEVVKRLLKEDRPIRLELGSRPRQGMEAWTSIDLDNGADIQFDLRQPLPFPDNSVDEIYSSHFLEHFTYPTPMLDLLRNCHRILRPGGRVRTAVPDAAIFLSAYADSANFDREKFCTCEVGLRYDSPIDVVNFIAYLGGEHKFMFDRHNLPKIFSEAGFRNARIREFDPSVDIEQRKHESLYAECEK